MRLSTYNRPLLRAWLASAVVFAGVTACRGDRAETGSSQGDQSGTAAISDTGTAAAQSALIDRDTTSTDTTSGADTAARRPATKPNRKNLQSSTPTAAPDTAISGYQAMSGEGTEDTATPDSTVATGDTTGDTVATGSAEMARDTSTALGQADTVAQQVQTDTVAQVQVDTTSQVTDTSTQVAADTGASIQVQVDTMTGQQQPEVATQAPADAAPADTAIVVGDSTEMGKPGERLEPNQASAEANADTLAAADAERVRPPEDSTEVLGNVTTTEDQAAEPEPTADQAPAAGAAVQPTGTVVTGAAAVATVTREGRRCEVVEGEESEEDIRWDLAGSPATMNPCGTGTMTLPRIQTGK